MAFADSYLGRLRQQVGSRLVLVPGASVTLLRDDGQVLLGRRTDTDNWGLPGGISEEGSSFARTAVTELREETGLEVHERDLVPFATVSEAELHTITYPNGDRCHGFALCFLTRTWRGELRPDQEETSELRFADPEHPPGPVATTTAHVLELLRAYQATGRFQVR
jgi:ADP-ribose pyrophosphatase YjhB (NUDIX family)